MWGRSAAALFRELRALPHTQGPHCMDAALKAAAGSVWCSAGDCRGQRDALLLRLVFLACVSGSWSSPTQGTAQGMRVFMASAMSAYSCTHTSLEQWRMPGLGRSKTHAMHRCDYAVLCGRFTGRTRQGTQCLHPDMVQCHATTCRQYPCAAEPPPPPFPRQAVWPRAAYKA